MLVGGLRGAPLSSLLPLPSQHMEHTEGSREKQNPQEREFPNHEKRFGKEMTVKGAKGGCQPERTPEARWCVTEHLGAAAGFASCRTVSHQE